MDRHFYGGLYWGVRVNKAEAQQGKRKALQSYVWGTALSLLLTLPIFYLATSTGRQLIASAGFAGAGSSLAVISGIAALLQITVHLRFFLHLRIKGQSREDVHLVLFTIFILLLMGGGTVWLLLNLSERM